MPSEKSSWTSQKKRKLGTAGRSYLYRLGLILILPLVSCGLEKRSTDEQASTSDQTDSSWFIEIPIGMQASSTWGLSAEASKFTIELTECSSGYQKLHVSDEDGLTLKVYQSDSDCVAGLKDFQWSNKDWSYQDGAYFLGPEIGFFDNNTDSQKLIVLNPYRLSNPVKDTDFVGFVFVELEAGDPVQLIQVSEAIGLPGGPPSNVSAPRLEHNGPQSISLSFIDDQSAVATLSIIVTCEEELVDGSCDGQDLLDMDLLLLPRTVESIDHGLASSLFANPPSGTSISPLQAENIMPSSGQTNGGFNVSIDSPFAITECSSFILIMRYLNGADEASFTYFSMNILTGPNLCQDT